VGHKSPCLYCLKTWCYDVITMEQKLWEFLAHRQKKPITDPKRIASAVLVPIYYKEGQCYILFTHRTDNVKEHKGQISFPGGARHGGESLLDTALREAAEEIGLAPADVEVLGELDDTTTLVTNYIVTPFVGIIPWPNKLKADGWESDEIIEVPIASLLDKKSREDKEEVVEGKPVTSYFYHYGGRVIWGATARILHQFLELYSRAI
jgi:8-oxo-dGTP pyrophosphatase MutT (NUDIX family)